MPNKPLYARPDAVNRANRLILAALVLLTLWVRLSTQMMIHTGVDERDYWYAAKALSQGFPYPALTHRTVRWAIILPVVVIQKIFGVHPNVYYVAPILNALCQTILLFALGTFLGGRRVGALAALFLIFFPYQIRAASQTRPEIFSITYMLLCAYPLAVALRSSGNRRIRYLLASSFALFLAYETKITNLFFLPGIFAVLLFFGKQGWKTGIRDCFVFGLPLLALFLAETGIYAAFTPFKFGQLSVIEANHLSSDYAAPLHSYLEIFKRYTPRYLEAYWQLPFVLFACACAPMLRKGRDAAIKSVAILGLSFFFFITFTITKTNPIMVAEDFINRYFCSVLPFVFIGVAWGAVRLLDRIAPTVAGAWTFAGPREYALICASLAVLVSVAFTLPIVPKSARQFAHSPLRPAEHPFAETARYYRTINDAWNSDEPIISANGLPGENAALTACRFFLSNDTYTDGRAPEPKLAEISGTTVHVVSRTGEAAGDSFIEAIRQPFRIAEVPLARVAEIQGERSIK